MKRFLRNISIFSLLVIVPIIVAEVYVRQMPNPARYKHQWMLRHSASINTLVLGSSHSFYGVSPKLLGDSAFSLAQPTQPYRYDYYQLTHYHLPHLRRVILPFSYQSLFEDLESEPHLQYWAVRYRLYMDCDLHSPLSRYGFECLHIASFKEKLTSLWRPSRLSWDSLGFGTSNGQQSLICEGRDNGPQRAAENTYPNMKSLRLCTDMLDSIATWCDHRGVSLVLLTTPTTPSFRKHCSQRQISVGDSTLRCLMERHPSSITHINHWADTAFKPADFYDADHLNTRGARKLTNLLRKELSRLDNKRK